MPYQCIKELVPVIGHGAPRREFSHSVREFSQAQVVAVCVPSSDASAHDSTRGSPTGRQGIDPIVRIRWHLFWCEIERDIRVLDRDSPRSAGLAV